MCKTNVMFDNDIIECLLEDSLDQISLMNSPNVLHLSSQMFSRKFLENRFDHSIELLNRSIKQIFHSEMNQINENGQLTNPNNSNRQSRYYHPTITIKQSHELRKRLQWIDQRQSILNQINADPHEQQFIPTT